MNDDTHSSESRPAGPGRGAAWPRVLGLVTALAILGGAGAWGVGAYNELVALDTSIDTQWKQVENQLERQFQLLPKVVAVAKRYAAHEKEVFESVAGARERFARLPSAERAARANEVDALVVQTVALSESYPNLKADRQFRDLSFEITGTKNRIAVERRRYNQLVGELEARLQQIPWRWLAGGFESREYYEPPQEHLAEPELDL